MQATPETATAPKKSKRLLSVDALRGVTVAAMLLVNDPGSWNYVYAPLDHAEWNGFTPTDFIFPMFLFVMGLSIALAVIPKLEKGAATAVVRNAALKRAVRIVVVGLLINALAMWLMPGREMRYYGVLQRIGICFAVAGMMAIYTPKKAWWISIIGLLVGYTIILRAGGTLDIYKNIVDRVDTALFGQYIWDYNPATHLGHDPEGLLSTLSALATTFFGLCAGVWLRHKKMGHLLGFAVALLVVGWVWHYWMPINKNLWTPTFALWTAGWSTLTLLVFYYAIEYCHVPAWGRRFGVNAIAAYAGSEIMQVLLPATGASGAYFNWMHSEFWNPYMASLACAVLFLFFWWFIVLVLDKNRWYIKI